MVEDNPKLVKKIAEPYVHVFVSDGVVKDVREAFGYNPGTLSNPIEKLVVSTDTVVGDGTLGPGKGFVPKVFFGALLSRISDDNSNRLFINSDPTSNPLRAHRCKIRNPEVLKFLKKYSNDNTFGVVYSAGMEVEASEVGLPEPVITPPPPAPPVPTPPGPDTTTGGGSGNDDESMGTGSSSTGKPGKKPGDGNLDKPEMKSTDNTQPKNNGLALIGLISAIIIIASMAIIWRRKKTLKK